MQMNRNRATIIFIVFMAIISIAYASISIYSPTVTETVGEFTITLTKDSSEPRLGTTLTLTGTLLYEDVGSSGQTVFLEQSQDSITWIQIQSTITGANGAFQFQVQRSLTGTFEYRVRFDY